MLGAGDIDFISLKTSGLAHWQLTVDLKLSSPFGQGYMLTLVQYPSRQIPMRHVGMGPAFSLVPDTNWCKAREGQTDRTQPPAAGRKCLSGMTANPKSGFRDPRILVHNQFSLIPAS